MTRLLLTVFAVCACHAAAAQQSGDAERGRTLASSLGCSGCHAIPGVDSSANVGPPLTGLGRRVYLAGQLPNTSANLIRWVTRTQEIRPGVAMPSTPLQAQQAADLAAFLESLR